MTSRGTQCSYFFGCSLLSWIARYTVAPRMTPSAKWANGAPRTAKITGILSSSFPAALRSAPAAQTFSRMHSTANVVTNPSNVHCIYLTSPICLTFL